MDCRRAFRNLGWTGFGDFDTNNGVMELSQPGYRGRRVERMASAAERLGEPRGLGELAVRLPGGDRYRRRRRIPDRLQGAHGLGL